MNMNMKRGRPSKAVSSSDSGRFSRTTVGLTELASERLDETAKAWGVSKYLAVSVILEGFDPENEAIKERLAHYTELEEAESVKREEINKRLRELKPEQLEELLRSLE